MCSNNNKANKQIPFLIVVYLQLPAERCFNFYRHHEGTAAHSLDRLHNTTAVVRFLLPAFVSRLKQCVRNVHSWGGGFGEV